MDPAVAALIGAIGGSVSGGLITGFFSLKGVEKQKEGDRELARESRLLDTRITLGGEFIALAYRVYGDLLQPPDADVLHEERHRLVLMAETLRLVLDREASEAVNQFSNTVTGAVLARLDDDLELTMAERRAYVEKVYEELGELQQMLNERVVEPGGGRGGIRRDEVPETDERPEIAPHAGAD